MKRNTMQPSSSDNPFGAEMARRGYVTLAFDASYQGESGGEPRHTVSPDALVEDFSASVD